MRLLKIIDAPSGAERVMDLGITVVDRWEYNIAPGCIMIRNEPVVFFTKKQRAKLVNFRSYTFFVDKEGYLYRTRNV